MTEPIRTAEQMREAAAQKAALLAVEWWASDTNYTASTLDNLAAGIRAIPIAPAVDREAVTLSVSKNMAREIAEWVDSERKHWPDNTVYHDELTALADILEAAGALK